MNNKHHEWGFINYKKNILKIAAELQIQTFMKTHEGYVFGLFVHEKYTYGWLNNNPLKKKKKEEELEAETAKWKSIK